MVAERFRRLVALATLACLPWLLAAEPGEAARPNALWERLSKVQRTELLMTLLGLILLGLLLLLVIAVGGRMARRYARHRPGAKEPDPDDWSRKPLVPALEDEDDSAADADDEGAK